MTRSTISRTAEPTPPSEARLQYAMRAASASQDVATRDSRNHCQMKEAVALLSMLRFSWVLREICLKNEIRQPVFDVVKIICSPRTKWPERDVATRQMLSLLGWEFGMLLRDRLEYFSMFQVALSIHVFIRQNEETQLEISKLGLKLLDEKLPDEERHECARKMMELLSDPGDDSDS